MTLVPPSSDDRPDEIPGDEIPGMDVSKTRQCLRCRAQFESQWAGERICARCKGTTSWRNGSSMPTISTSDKR